jgi:hypothetical protein
MERDVSVTVNYRRKMVQRCLIQRMLHSVHLCDATSLGRGSARYIELEWSLDTILNVTDANVGLERVENRKFGVDDVLFVVDRESRDFVLCPSSFNTKSAAKS